MLVKGMSAKLARVNPFFRALSVSPDSETPYSDVTRTKKTTNHIKRPMNAFMAWSQDERRRICSEHPEMHNAEISKRLGKMWRVLDEDIKRQYIAYADQLRVWHAQQYPDYKYRPKKRGKGKPKTRSKSRSRSRSRISRSKSEAAEPLKMTIRLNNSVPRKQRNQVSQSYSQNRPRSEIQPSKVPTRKKYTPSIIDAVPKTQVFHSFPTYSTIKIEPQDLESYQISPSYFASPPALSPSSAVAPGNFPVKAGLPEDCRSRNDFYGAIPMVKIKQEPLDDYFENGHAVPDNCFDCYRVPLADFPDIRDLSDVLDPCPSFDNDCIMLTELDDPDGEVQIVDYLNSDVSDILGTTCFA